MRVFGDIPDLEPGDEFESREALAEAGVHPPTVAGISGSQHEGADSIVLSGGYEDDEDFGDVIIYTGSGGQKNGKQVADQALKGRNRALARSKIEGLPIRVTRGFKHRNELSPKSGYRYCGLFFVDDFWCEKGKSGFYVWRYRLIADEKSATSYLIGEPPSESAAPKRKQSSVNRIVRDYQRALNVKSWHASQCQICGLAISTSAGLYAEAAHIQPLGAPHGGPDIEENMLCLCPNHHVMFDNGGFTIDDDLSLIGIPGKLKAVARHNIGRRFIRYHREHYTKNA
ncbi:YDG/SRA domain-containing protein [Marinobacter sp. F4218]|uniref:YDG/SRA domain-containing protein n=1 Tax=Marinobacter sp. F4218 TaxID=2862868 RepID=UPI001C6387B6|nr:YDG/SRA domain-containing protein [Marinobacter sp. F4218]MBW7471159.1 HNH endonuclease [Marinobacter sp. F4218]